MRKGECTGFCFDCGEKVSRRIQICQKCIAEEIRMCGGRGKRMPYRYALDEIVTGTPLSNLMRPKWGTGVSW